MKKYLIMLFVMLAASQAFAKKDKKDEKDLKIDSLTKAIDSLRVHYDSLSRGSEMRYDSVYKKLNDVYIIIKEKVLKKEFNPDHLPYVLDSLIALRDSNFVKYSSNTATLMDSLAILKKDNIRMKAILDGIMADETGRNRLIYELKQLKDLLDSGILTRTEFDVLKGKLLAKW